MSDSNARELRAVVRQGDIVLLHDPQTAGLCAPMRDHGVRVVWRCHVGLDAPNDIWAVRSREAVTGSATTPGVITSSAQQSRARTRPPGVASR